jgi:AcrR family transcriptional regulator
MENGVGVSYFLSIERAKKDTFLYISYQSREKPSGIQESSSLDKRGLLKSAPHKQERALATRRELIRAARTVFTRDGFESARIEDVAAMAGKTRGAFYDNFKDKEDVFFAIFEEDLLRDQEKINAALAAASDPEERIDVLSRHLIDLLEDRQRVLLMLEFKMYVIRHHSKRKRLNELYTEMCLRCGTTKVNRLVPELADGDLEMRRRLTAEIGMAIDGIALTSMFNPEGLSKERRMEFLKVAARQAARNAAGSK